MNAFLITHVEDVDNLVIIREDLLSFSAPKPRVRTTRQLLDQRFLSVALFARNYLDTALQEHRDGSHETVRQLIVALLPGGRCTAQQVAHHLRMDRRTLQRHLGSEGQTFSMLLDQVRGDLAKRHLQDSGLTAGEVSQLLGFSGPSAFSHWFRAQFGCTAREWRQQARTARQGGDAS